FGKDLVLDLHKNVVTVTEDLLVRTFDEQGKEIVERSLVKHCQYQGHIQGDPESIIVLDTCDGLRGMIEDAEQELLIEPFKSKGVNAHKLSRIKKPEKINCGVEGHNRKGLYHNNERVCSNHCNFELV
ncbi:zinc metalloproteinase/disintegrin, partial [Exaiptasia diaphana]|uniref:Peptidase M12B propeptide domain-containing protein n=1 Tax=Exaiptasia diaphana TaxID=2652724 RepID=A0A913YYP2_EXADI